VNRAIYPAVCAILLSLALPAPAQIKGNLNPKDRGFAVLTVEGKAENVTWRIAPQPVQRETEAGKLRFSGMPAVEYRVTAQVINVDWKAQKLTVNEYEESVWFGDKVPGPGPAPGPGPTPTPTPTPDAPPPIAGPGFKVLIVLEKTLQHELTSQQTVIVFGEATRQYVKSKDGELAVLDKDNDAGSLPKAWQDAMKRPRKSLPWVLISNGVTGYEGPLPGHEEEWKLLLKKYGGQ
jgi:hypothetical protein